MANCLIKSQAQADEHAAQNRMRFAEKRYADGGAEQCQHVSIALMKISGEGRGRGNIYGQQGA